MCLLSVPAPKEVVFEDVSHLGKPAALPHPSCKLGLAQTTHPGLVMPDDMP